ncbi:TPA: hypothetical protein IAB95_03270 [Candidatus Ventrenecus avicola]|nr:hypothetical protein [Candidatus Ventrenecus avicola]
MARILNNRNVIIITTLLILILLVGGTLWKVRTDSLNRSITVVEKRITEGFQACQFDDVCQNDEITLGELISLGYAKEEVNPVTKLYYSHDSIVRKEENDYIFEEK